MERIFYDIVVSVIIIALVGGAIYFSKDVYEVIQNAISNTSDYDKATLNPIKEDAINMLGSDVISIIRYYAEHLDENVIIKVENQKGSRTYHHMPYIASEFEIHYEDHYEINYERDSHGNIIQCTCICVE